MLRRERAKGVATILVQNLWTVKIIGGLVILQLFCYAKCERSDDIQTTGFLKDILL